jgi:hypothetical protein
MNDAITALVAAAKRLSLPTRHTDDLHVHDRNNIERNGGDQPFAWLVYDLGTCMLRPETPESKRHRAGRQSQRAWLRNCHPNLVDTLVDCFCHGEHAWFWWDGRALRPSTAAKCKRLIAEHEARLERAERKAS